MSPYPRAARGCPPSRVAGATPRLRDTVSRNVLEQDPLTGEPR